MNRPIVITDAGITTAGSGGGSVAYHEMKALGEATPTLDNGGHANCFVVDRRINDPTARNLPLHPFMVDWLTYEYLTREGGDIPLDLWDAVLFNGNGFYCTCKLAEQKGAKIIADVPAHNLETSIEEFEKGWNTKYPYPHMTDPFTWNLFTYHIKKADIVIFPSHYSKNYLVKKLALSEDKLRVIPHGCELAKLREPPAEFSVLHVSQAGPDKGQKYLLQAWVGYKNTGAPGKLVVAGQGTEQLEKMLSGDKLKDTEFLGYVESNWKLGQLFNECSVYVQPSVTEGFGLEVLEAMAHGRPTVVTEGAGVSELVKNGKNGFKVPIRDPKALLEKVLYFRDSPDEVKRMGQNAYETAKEHTWEKVEAQYVDEFKKLG